MLIDNTSFAYLNWLSELAQLSELAPVYLLNRETTGFHAGAASDQLAQERQAAASNEDLHLSQAERARLGCASRWKLWD